MIYAQVEQHEFAALVAEEALPRRGQVGGNALGGQTCAKLKYRHESLPQLSQVEEWERPGSSTWWTPSRP